MGLVNILLILALFSAMFLVHGNARPQVPAIYVFGDSTVDVGNNNHLPGIEGKANYPHYGIDFPGSIPTGRFSNAYVVSDFVAITMGFKRSPPAYFSLGNNSREQVLRGRQGVNFASSGSGILNSTGVTIPTANQIEYFAAFRSNLAARIGNEFTNFLLSQSIFLFSVGINDIMAYAKSPSADAKEFITTLVSQYKDRLKSLYDLGARKFAVIDVPPIGCSPSLRIYDPSGNCSDFLNDLVQGFNKATQALLQNLSFELEGMKYSIGSSYALVSKIIADPEAAGFEDVKSACCGTGVLNAETLCIPTAHYCTHRGRYLFWDSLHQTHATARVSAYAFYFRSSPFVAPINFKQLAEAYYSNAVSRGALTNNEGFASA